MSCFLNVSCRIVWFWWTRFLIMEVPRPRTFSVQHRKTPTNYSCTTRIITKSTSISVPTPTCSSLSSQFLGAPFNLHKFWFCADDMNCYMGGTKHRYVMDRPVVTLIWHVQKGTNLSHNDVKTLKEASFVFNKQPILPWSLFAKENFIPINRCSVVAQNTKWEACFTHITIYHVKITL